MHWKKYKTILLHEHCAGIIKLTEYMLLNHSAAESKDKVFIAALAEVAQHLKAKLVNYQQRYNCTFTPVQSIALEALLTNYVLPEVKKLGDFENRMLQLQIGILNTYNA